MKEVLLCKYGEIVLKGANKKFFEDVLCRELKHRAKNYGDFEISRAQSTIYIDPKDDTCDIDGMVESARKVFGIVGIGRSAVCEKNMDSIRRTVREYIPQFLRGHKTFKVEAKRADKAFPLDSMAISADIGGVILETCKGIKVDVHNPDVTVRVEIREHSAYVHAGQIPGAGGMPAGSSGNGMLLLSGGIDSPVAGYMMAKRGLKLDALYFESPPYTGELAKEKVVNLAKVVAEYAGDINLHVISLTHIQEELVKNCEEDYFTLLLRRYMMALADRAAKKFGCKCLITGESLAQVASQTLDAIGVTNPMTTLPVFRPCIGMDKEEIVQISHKIGTYDISIQPYEDCCTVFTPRHPRTRPELAKVQEQENKLDFNALCDEAFEGMYRICVKGEY